MGPLASALGGMVAWEQWEHWRLSLVEWWPRTSGLAAQWSEEAEEEEEEKENDE